MAGGFYLLEQGAFSLPDGSRLYVIKVYPLNAFSKLKRVTLSKSVVFNLPLG